MTSILTGQLIRGTDKRHPLFTVDAEEQDDPERLHVYSGLELLEAVSADRNDPGFKMLGGRRHNPGVSLRVLRQTFQSDATTIQRWGRALRSRDAVELVRVLEGRRARRKLRPELKAYGRARWSDLARAGLSGVGKRLRQEIQRLCGVQLSQETLRPWLGELKQPPAAATPPESSGPTTAEGLPPSGQNASADQALGPAVWEKPCAGAAAEVEPEPGTSWALESTPQTLGCDPLGLLLLAPVVGAVAPVVDPPQAFFREWLASLFLGALNIEQTKFLHWPDLSRLLGEGVRLPHPQRQELERGAPPAHLEALARFNAQQMGAASQHQFYFDPHPKHYPGEQNVLEGWGAAIRWADNARPSDFIHTVSGEPLYFETTGPFADLRQRFFEAVRRCRQVMQWPQERVLTWVVDRAILGQEVFAKVRADPALHLITWEKGDPRQAGPPSGGISGSRVIERARNRAEDLRSYPLEYWDRPWPKDERLRPLVGQATPPPGRVIHVSISRKNWRACARGRPGGKARRPRGRSKSKRSAGNWLIWKPKASRGHRPSLDWNTGLRRQWCGWIRKRSA